MMARLYPAYARDVLSFLNFSQLQECRLVSRSVNATIAHPIAIPARRHLEQLSLSMRSVEEFGTPRIYETGYAEVTKCNGFNEKHWKEVQAGWGCCRDELEELAQSLIGERILPASPADYLVEFWIKIGEWHTRYADVAVLFARNEMTPETAFGVLHLLEHLRHVHFSGHIPPFRYEASGELVVAALNPSFMRLLGGSYRLHMGNYWPFYLPESIAATVAELAHLKIGELKVALGVRGGDLRVALEFALRGKYHCRHINLMDQRSDAFNSALQYFQSTLPLIGRDVVRELTLHGYAEIDFWPDRLPAKEEMESLGLTIRGVDLYRLPGGLTNIHSGERFQVEVMMCEQIDWDDEDEKRVKALCGLRLRFR